MESKVIQLNYPGKEQGWETALTDTVLRTADEISRLEGSITDRAILVLTEHEAGRTPDHIKLSVQDAVRSIMHASILENPGLSLALILDGQDRSDLERTLQYLTGTEGAFVYGATIDLGSKR